MQTFRFWLQGIRFYIAVAALLITGLVAWWAHTAYPDSPLAAIRTQETFAWLALGLLAAAAAIGPAYKLFPKLAGRRMLFDARRLIGISSAWFASLHAATAYVAQFKAANPLSLPHNYQVAFALGGVALLALLAMAFTSFDRAFKSMGVWWFRLHRIVYPVIVLTLLHLFMIGVHATVLPVLVSLAAVSGIIVVMHLAISWRAKRLSFWQLITIGSMAICLALAFTYGFHARSNSLAHRMNARQQPGPSS